jgi:5-methylcytosine-specific restriction endonuclease McrA
MITRKYLKRLDINEYNLHKEEYKGFIIRISPTRNSVFIYDINSRHYKDLTLGKLRGQIRTRENNRCADCGTKFGKLVIHHILGEEEPIRKGYMDLRAECNKPENLVLLCRTCHGKRHKHLKREKSHAVGSEIIPKTWDWSSRLN